MKEAHFVTFFSPGTFVAETTTKAVTSWDIEQAKAMARAIQERHGAVPYGFQFSTRTRGDEDLDSHVAKKSPMYYLGGTVETLAQLKARATEKDEILVRNMEGNRWERIITNDNSWRWTQPLQPTDVVLEWESKGTPLKRNGRTR